MDVMIYHTARNKKALVVVSLASYLQSVWKEVREEADTEEINFLFCLSLQPASSSLPTSLPRI